VLKHCALRLLVALKCSYWVSIYCIRYAHTIVLSMSCCTLHVHRLYSLCSYCCIRCAHTIVYLVRSAHYDRACTLVFALLIPSCLHLFNSRKLELGYERPSAISRITYVGPKGPGLSEKISRCSWIFRKLRLFLSKTNQEKNLFQI
jgi:hypothetical protein